MANLYTYAVRSMAKQDSIDKHYCQIVEKLNTVLTTLEDLVEDPLFLDTIHGEQEMSLDLTLELLDQIIYQFTPEQQKTQSFPYPQDDSYDAD